MEPSHETSQQFETFESLAQLAQENEEILKIRTDLTILSVFRNLPEEKCVEFRSDSGLVFYFESRFDPREDITINTVRGDDGPSKAIKGLTSGNHTKSVMQSLFAMYPSNVPMPDFEESLEEKQSMQEGSGF